MKLINEEFYIFEDDKPKILSTLHNFMSELEVDGICGFWIDEEEDDHGNYWVYIILDLDWIKEIPTKPQFVAERMRRRLQEEIKKWLGFDVRVGSTARKCSE